MQEIVNPTLRAPKTVGITPVWDENCKILILGSITAVDGMRKGFYYASARNQFWELLDCCLGNEVNEEGSFTFLKNVLRYNFEKYDSKEIEKAEFERNKALIREKFADKLLQNKIAICDVFEECYFNNNSSLDMDIILNNEKYPYKTNREVISHILSHSKIDKVIVNSRFVEDQFKKMNIEGDFELKYAVSPSPRKGKLDKKISQWKGVFGEK